MKNTNIISASVKKKTFLTFLRGKNSTSGLLNLLIFFHFHDIDSRTILEFSHEEYTYLNNRLTKNQMN